MAGPAYATQARWRNELVLDNGTSIGFWDRAEMDFTSENQTITDPEDGQQNIGGRQTAGDVEFTRPWKVGRDTAAFKTALAGRGRVGVTIIVHELDVYLNPVTTAPLDTWTGIITQTNLPESSAGGDDPSTASITVTVNP